MVLKKQQVGVSKLHVCIIPYLITCINTQTTSGEALLAADEAILTLVNFGKIATFDVATKYESRVASFINKAIIDRCSSELGVYWDDVNIGELIRIEDVNRTVQASAEAAKANIKAKKNRKDKGVYKGGAFGRSDLLGKNEPKRVKGNCDWDSKGKNCTRPNCKWTHTNRDKIKKSWGF